MKEKKESINVIHLNRIKEMKNTQSRKGRKGAKPPARIIAITSGKGGVGKTNIVANLGYSLAKSGNKVLIFDADLGLGNLDVLLGIAPRYNLSHVINGEKSLSEIIIDGPGNLKILPASSGVQELTRLSREQKYHILRAMDEITDSYDIVLIDTAAGISSNVLYFNASAHEIIVVVTPEPTSITDAYALMKVLSMKYQEKQFRLLVNSVANKEEADEVFRQLRLVASKFLDISIEYFGNILNDENVRKGVKRQKVVSEMAPFTKASRGFAMLAKKISKMSAEELPFKDKNVILKNFLMHTAD